jgi:hypothetical protein
MADDHGTAAGGLLAAYRPTYLQFLSSLAAILRAAEAHARTNGNPPEHYFGARLIEDMQPLSFQLLLLIHYSVNALRTAHGLPSLQHQGDLGSFDGAIAGLDWAREQVAAIPDDAPEQARVDIPFPGRPTAFTGADYMATCALPQFFFHHAIAYGLLRGLGVPIGKFDYLGEMRTL